MFRKPSQLVRIPKANTVTPFYTRTGHLFHIELVKSVRMIFQFFPLSWIYVCLRVWVTVETMLFLTVNLLDCFNYPIWARLIRELIFGHGHGPESPESETCLFAFEIFQIPSVQKLARVIAGRAPSEFLRVRKLELLRKFCLVGSSICWAVPRRDITKFVVAMGSKEGYSYPHLIIFGLYWVSRWDWDWDARRVYLLGESYYTRCQNWCS